jgi:hypothetical protein
MASKIDRMVFACSFCRYWTSTKTPNRNMRSPQMQLRGRCFANIKQYSSCYLCQIRTSIAGIAVLVRSLERAFGVHLPSRPELGERCPYAVPFCTSATHSRSCDRRVCLLSHLGITTAHPTIRSTSYGWDAMCPYHLIRPRDFASPIANRAAPPTSISASCSPFWPA